MNQIQKNKLKRYALVAFLVTTGHYIMEYLFGTKNPFVNKLYLWSPDGNDVIFATEFITLPFKVSNFWNIPLATICVAYFLFRKYSSNTADKMNIFFHWIMIGSAYGVLLALSGFLGMIIGIAAIGVLFGIIHSTIFLDEENTTDVEIFDFKTEIKSFPTALVGVCVSYGLFYNLAFGIVVGGASLLIGFIVFSISYSVSGFMSGYIVRAAEHSWDISKKWLSGK